MARSGWVIVALSCVACGAHTPPTANRASSIDERLSSADALLRAGCYDCLKDALDLYEPLASANSRARAGMSHAAGLLAVRERELGLRDSSYLEQARSANFDPTDDVLFDVIETLPRQARTYRTADDDGLAASTRGRRNRDAWRPLLRERRDRHFLAAEVEAAYECAFGDRSRDRVDVGGDAVQTPLIQFTLATCRNIDTALLETLLRENPRFVEINFFLALASLTGNPDRPLQRLQAALEWRPDWRPPLVTAGDLAVRIEDFGRAVEFYDRALASGPPNPDIRLRRVRALSYAGRYQLALDAADEMLTDRRWYAGGALYWRAWNEAQLDRVDAAWTDVHDAAKLVVDADVPKLTGVLAIRRGELTVAREQLEIAHSRNGSDCETSALLGEVKLELREWAAASPSLIEAVACLDTRDAEVREQIRGFQSASGREAALRHREEELAGNQRLRMRSWFNLAAAAFNSNDTTTARTYAERVVDDERFSARARELLSRIK